MGWSIQPTTTIRFSATELEMYLKDIKIHDVSENLFDWKIKNCKKF